MHQEPADLYQMGKLLWIQVFYSLSVSLFCSERWVVAEGFHEPRMTVLREGLPYPFHVLTTETLQSFEDVFLAAEKLRVEPKALKDSPHSCLFGERVVLGHDCGHLNIFRASRGQRIMNES